MSYTRALTQDLENKHFRLELCSWAVWSVTKWLSDNLLVDH